MWRLNPFDVFRQDLAYAFRLMRRSPGFTAVAVLSLALGVGANTAIFSLINALMLRTLPVSDPHRLVQLLSRYPGEPRVNGFSWNTYEYFREQNHVFSDLIGVSPTRFQVGGESIEKEEVMGEYVVGTYFSTLGVKPVAGRLIDSGDDQLVADSSAVAVVSWSYWKSHFNLNQTILGKKILVDDLPVTVIGVAPRDFFGLEVGVSPQIWVPVAMEALIQHPSRRVDGQLGMELMGRLRPGVSIVQAQAEMNVLDRWRIETIARTSRDPLIYQLRIEVEPAAAGFSRLRDRFGRPLLLLMAIVVLLLLIACINIASLLLARGVARQREMALRLSLGAGQFRLIRQVLTESLLLSAVGAILGIILAYYGADALVRLLASARQIPGMPSRIDVPVHPDIHVLSFTVGIALLTGVLFGLAPAWEAFTSAPATSLREFGAVGNTKSKRLFGRGLVTAQVALSVVLLSAAILFVGHLSNLENLDLGFQRDRVLIMTLDSAHSRYEKEHLFREYQGLLERLEAIPGVRSATVSAVTPISGAGVSRFVTVEGHPEPPASRRYVSLNLVAPKYFETYGTPILAGRDFNPHDQAHSPVALINLAMAHHYFASENPIGKHFTFDADNKSYEIIGIVGDAKYGDIREDTPPTIYLNMFQEGQAASQFALRTSIDPTAVANDARRTVRESLKTVPVVHTTTLADQINASIVPERLIASLSGLFGALGAVLAAIGLYGLLAYTVTRRVKEIGIRMALGATPCGVILMILKDALGIVCIGMCSGALIWLWARTIAQNLLADVPVKSMAPIAFAALAMLVIAAMAAYGPAHRAAHVDPTEALRYE